jgi:membrane protein implicated in regulation of membrane protease activity
MRRGEHAAPTPQSTNGRRALQGIVGIVTAVVAGGCAAVAGSPGGGAVSWPVATAAFVITLVLLFVYWDRSLAEVRSRLTPMYPSPPGEFTGRH